MSLLLSVGNLSKARSSFYYLSRCLHGLPQNPDEQLSGEANYPKIEPFKTRLEEKSFNLESTFSGLRTVEERLYYLNKPKFFGWYSVLIDVNKTYYDTLDFTKYVTWTQDVQGLPEVYDSLEESSQALAASLAPKVKTLMQDQENSQAGFKVPNDRLKYRQGKPMPDVEYRDNLWKNREIELKTRRLHRLISANIAKDVPHIMESQADYDFRNEAFWFRGGFFPDKRMVGKFRGTNRALDDPNKKLKISRKEKFTEEQIWAKHDRAIQIRPSHRCHHGLVQLRHALMAPPYVDLDHAHCHAPIDNQPWDPKCHGYTVKPQPGVNTPGFWANSEKGYALLQIVNSHNTADDRLCNVEGNELDREKMLLTKAIQSSFALLLSSSYQSAGHAPLSDPTRPLVTQTILTDGNRFKLSCYQLNKTALHRELGEGDANNVIWHEKEFDLIKEDGEVDVEGLAKMIKFYIREPSVEMERECMVAEQIDSDYNRSYFFDKFREMQGRHRTGLNSRPEILAHDRLYDIAHPQMWFGQNVRERPWYKMAKIDYKGREHWHPEYKEYDHYRPSRIPKSMRDPSLKYETRQRKVFPPVPNEDQHDFFPKGKGHDTQWLTDGR